MNRGPVWNDFRSYASTHRTQLYPETQVNTEPGQSAAPDAAENRAENRMADLARDLVDKVGIEGAVRYCHSLGWLGVLTQVELLRGQY